MQNPPPVQTGKSSTGLDENLAALLSYVLGWISGLIFFLMEKDSRLVRFHAMQSILFNVTIGVLLIVVWIASFIIVIVLGMISDTLVMLGSLIITLLIIVICLGALGLLIMCLIKAYNRQMYKLPIIGNFAEKFSAPK